MNKKWTSFEILIGVVIIVVLILAFLPFPFHKSAQGLPTGTKTGLRAPDFTLQALDGSVVSLHNLRGQPVFINFWTSWCTSCQLEMPELVKFYEMHKHDLAVLTIDISYNDKIDDVKKELLTNHAAFPVLQDEDSLNGATASYQVNALPTSFFIDKDGIIRDIHMGPMTVKQLEDDLKKIKT